MSEDSDLMWVCCEHGGLDQMCSGCLDQLLDAAREEGLTKGRTEMRALFSATLRDAFDKGEEKEDA